MYSHTQRVPHFLEILNTSLPYWSKASTANVIPTIHSTDGCPLQQYESPTPKTPSNATKCPKIPTPFVNESGTHRFEIDKKQ
jgi:hypothetical protein